MTRVFIVLALLFVLASPATAQAPTLDEQVAALQQEVNALDLRVQLLEDAVPPPPTTSGRDPCITWSMAISKRLNGNLYMTRRRMQSHVYVALVDRSCQMGLHDDYRWPGYRNP